VVELDAFRPLLAKMLTQVLELYCKQLDATRSTFISQQRSESNTIADTLPTITRKLYWAKALMDSLRAMQSTLSLLQRLFESCKIDGYEEALTGTSMLLNAISKLDVVTYRLWVKKVEALPEDLLNQPLVVILEPTQDDTDLSSNGTQTSSIKINFNDNVLEIIKEAKYLKYLGYDLPGMASYLYDRSEKIRGYIGHLKLIANKYNNLYAMTQEPEWPLVGRILYHLHELLIEVSNVITWKSNRIDDTIIKMTTEMNIVNETMDKLKRNRAEIMRILEEEWGERPLFRFKKTQSYSLSAFDSMHSVHVEARYKVLKSGARTISSLIEDNIVVSGANWTIPCFVDYADYLRTLCSDWLKAFVKDNLLRLLDALAYENTDSMTSGQNRSEAQNDMSVAMALIEMTLELLHGTVFEYVPPIKSADSHQKTVESSVLQWRDSILEATTYATHDPLSLDFKAEIAADAEIVRLQNLVGDCIDKTAQSCSEYRDSFADYEFLWLEAGEERFQHVVRTVIMPNGDKLPNMHAMGEIVHHLLDLQVRLTTYLDFKRIDWVRVDSRPLKSAIATLLSCRLERHIVFLKECLGKNLDGLNAYLVQTMGELTKASDLRTGNEYMLSLVLRAVRSIKEKKREFEATMRSSESIATFLQGHGWAIEPPREAQLTSTLKLWTEMQKFALQVKDKYSSLIAQEIERLRKRGTNLEETCANAKKKCALAPIWAPGDTSDVSYDKIREMHNEIRWLMCSQTEVYEMESLLESTPMHNCMPIINECFLMMYAAKTLWDVHELVGLSLRTWNFIKWADVCVDKMLVEAQEFMQMLMDVSQSPNQNTQHILQYYVCNSKLYTKIQEEIQYMLDSLPLALELQSPFLRERHFKKIMSISGQAFALDENVLFRNILSLQLPSFADDIYTLVDSAERELLGAAEACLF
jgi:dynein heavy chain